ncbi:MAG: prolipoprotein diacylglyceryl transferase [Myxococcales bacterium]|nr:prolipoprotein diacylglyceryl transferase [Myxococcales bacterium]
MHPVLIDFGWLWSLAGFDPAGAWRIHTYGMMIAIGFIVGMQLAAREARRIDVSDKGGFDDFIADLTFWLVISGIAGARILFIMVEWDAVYARDPLKIFRIWEGGFVFYGGFIGALLFSIAYCRHHSRSFFMVADTLIPYVALGHFFGRLGCLAAGCCWGIEAHPDNLLTIQFPAGALAHGSMVRSGIIAPDAEFTPHVHPVQLYEAFGELSIYFALLFIRSIKRFHGQVILAYFFMYPMLRTSLEFIRGDKERGEYAILGLEKISTSQIISAGIALAAITMLVTLVIREKRRAPTT